MARVKIRRWWWIVGGVAVLSVAGFLLWPTSSDRALPPPRAVVYKDFQACLLTGPQGLADAKVTPVWDGMQDASKATRAKVSYLATTEPDTAANATPYVATLLQRQCNIVITVGEVQAAAATEQAAQHPEVQFVEVGGSTGSGNVTTLSNDSPAQQRTAIAELIHDWCFNLMRSFRRAVA